MEEIDLKELMSANKNAGTKLDTKVHKTKKGAKIIEKLAFDTKELDMRIIALKAMSYKPDIIFLQEIDLYTKRAYNKNQTFTFL